MPLPGHQHKSSLANPFDEAPPRMAEYTAQQVATLQSRLEKQLGPEYISSRVGPSGQKVHYIAAEKCIMLANEVFGFNGWSSSIRDMQVDFVDENPNTGKISLGLSVIVRVSLKDGAYHEDIGYGHIENCKGKAAAFEKAKKEGTTDALKRALRNFGNILGNCVYDKEYLARITKMKVAPNKWDPDNLHRHADHAPKKEPILTREEPTPVAHEEPTPVNGEENEDEFGVADFDDVDFSIAENAHPDEITLESSIERASSPQKRVEAPAALLQPSASTRGVPNPGMAHLNNVTRAPNVLLPGGAPAARTLNAASLQPRADSASAGPAAVLSSIARDLGEYEHDPNVGFCQARVAEKMQNGDSSVLKAAPFNPKQEPTTLRRTNGVDHSMSKPLTRPRVGSSVPSAPNSTSKGNFVHPHLDPHRRIGMPATPASPLQNRHTYKAPSMKRPPEPGAEGRPALSDVTMVSANVPPDIIGDGKRMKMEAPMGRPRAT